MIDHRPSGLPPTRPVPGAFVVARVCHVCVRRGVEVERDGLCAQCGPVVRGWGWFFDHIAAVLATQTESRAAEVQVTPAQAVEAFTTVFDSPYYGKRENSPAVDASAMALDGSKPPTPDVWQREMDNLRARLAAREYDLGSSDAQLAGVKRELAAVTAERDALRNATPDDKLEDARRDARMADYRWGQRLKAMDLRIERAVAILHGRDTEHAYVLAADLPFLSDAAHAAPVEGLAGVAVGACGSMIEALMPVVAGKALINSRADAIAGVSLMMAQLASLCAADDYRSEYEFHLQMLRERHAKATDMEIPF